MSQHHKSTRLMKKLRKEFYEEGQRLHAEGNPEANCWLCSQPIDYDAAPGTTPDSHELDHFHTVSEHPELQEDPTNFRHSHTLCNSKRGNRSPSLGLGDLVPDWW
ncbi:hypothetical protein [Lysinibacter sp. HNR]|uniref:hypothetical protein n=1 Tax=Lysinibacter sp. HNR TaxID=3031408 RepID=UPI0024352534|nr:hypothetical protein [Lysinibacter sp. HNR]WGD38488.1 hypothetical protein FrondiHNR_06145 [Lysinibacter sp. HNR]